MGTKVTTTSECHQDINTRIRKANQAFAMLKPVWRTTNLSVQTNLKIFRSNVLYALLYGAECWKTTVTILQKLGVQDQIPLMHSQELPAQHHLKRRTEKKKRNGHSGRNHTKTVVAVVRPCLPHALQLHHQNSPQMDTSGQEKGSILLLLSLCYFCYCHNAGAYWLECWFLDTEVDCSNPGISMLCP